MMTFTIDQVIKVLGKDEAEKLIASVDLPDSDITASFQWKCGVEGRWWTATCRVAFLSDLYALRYFQSDEAGVMDKEIIERQIDIDSEIEELRFNILANGDGPSGIGEIRVGNIYHR